MDITSISLVAQKAKVLREIVTPVCPLRSHERTPPGATQETKHWTTSTDSDFSKLAGPNTLVKEVALSIEALLRTRRLVRHANQGFRSPARSTWSFALGDHKADAEADLGREVRGDVASR